MDYLNSLILKNRINALVFIIKRVQLYIINWIEKRRVVKSFRITVLKKLIYQFIKNLILVAFIVYLDNIIIDKYIKFGNVINENLISDLIIAGVSIAGIFLGLYCSNLTSIYATKYSNAPDSIAHVFETEIVTNNSINLIISYIVFSLILLSANLTFGINNTSLFIFILFTIWIIITFGLIGNKRQRLSDTYGIAQSVYKKIENLINKAASRSKLAKDISFQNHYYKLCVSELNVLDDIAKYNLNDSSNRNEAMVQFMAKNNSVLSSYLKYKKQIPFTSLWFHKKDEYQKWFYASDQEVSIALRSGTTLNHKQVINYMWFEERIIETNGVMLDKLISVGDYSSLRIFCHSLMSLAEHVIENELGEYFLEYIEKIQGKIVNHYTSMVNKQDEKNDEEFIQLIDSLLLIYIEFVISTNKYLNSINWEKLKKYALALFDYNDLDLRKNRFLNNRKSEKLYHGILAELKIEKNRITPDWYIEQSLALNIFEIINKGMIVLDKLYNEIVFKLGETFTENGYHLYAMLVYSRMSELYSKMQYSTNIFMKLAKILNEKHVDQSIIWPESHLSIHNQNTIQTNKELARLWAASAVYFTTNNWNYNNKYPDLPGQCYNYICDTLINSIIENDFDFFSTVYPNLLVITLIYQEVMRKELIKADGQNNKAAITSLYASPIIEYMTISGYAFLWGEVVDKQCWKDIINEQLERYLAKQGDKAIELCITWISLATLFTNRNSAIYNRDLIHANWKQRFAYEIREKGLLIYEWGMYNQRLKTNNTFLKAFFGSSPEFIFLSAEAYEAYIIQFINKRVPQHEQYKSRSDWERHINEESEDD